MAHDETHNPQADLLLVGELISLQQAAEYAGLTKDTLHNYVKCAAPATRIQRIPMLVERRGLEPLTLCLQSRCSPN